MITKVIENLGPSSKCKEGRASYNWELLKTEHGNVQNATRQNGSKQAGDTVEIFTASNGTTYVSWRKS